MSDTEGVGREGVVPEGVVPEDVGVEEDWAFAKRKDKRTAVSESWKIETGILEDAKVTTEGVGEENAKR